MNHQVIHFDSINAIMDNLNDPFSCRFNFQTNLHNVSQISLKSLELPILFPNVRNSGSMNQFAITISGTVYSVTLPTQNYVSIGTLCTDITTAFAGVTLPNSGVLTLSAGLTNVICSIVSQNVQTIFTINNTQLAFYILGFKNQSAQINTTSGSNRTSTRNGLCSFNLNIDNYLNILLSNVSASNNANANGSPCSFKIPLNGLYNDILYLQENQTFKQFITLSGSNVLNYIKVSVTDRFGNILTNNGNDFSFTLEFQYNPNVNDYLN